MALVLSDETVFDALRETPRTWRLTSEGVVRNNEGKCPLAVLLGCEKNGDVLIPAYNAGLSMSMTEALVAVADDWRIRELNGHHNFDEVERLLFEALDLPIPAQEGD